MGKMLHRHIHSTFIVQHSSFAPVRPLSTFYILRSAFSFLRVPLPPDLSQNGQHPPLSSVPQYPSLSPSFFTTRPAPRRPLRSERIRMHGRITLAIALTLVVSGCIHKTNVPAPVATPAPAAAPASAPTIAAANPFLAPSPLLYQAPQFDKIKDSDYQPALEEGMKRQITEVDAIANNPQPATLENTIVPMEKSGALLTRTAKVFFNLTQSNLNDELQRIQGEEAPKLAAHQDAIGMNPKLFARIKAIYDARETLGLDAESKFLVERYYRNFVRAGALLNDADQTRLRALNQEESTLTTKFRDKVLADRNASAVVVD